MRVAVLGGTGLAGRRAVAALTAAGDEPVVVARSTGVDVVTGRGLDAALDGVEAVIDATNITTMRRDAAVGFFTAASRQVQAAAARAGVRRLVVLSIVGVDRVELGYYRGKLAQERIALSGEIPATVLRATQFHEFAGQVISRTRRGPVTVVPKMRIQPVASDAVGAELARLAAAPAAGTGPQIAGPEQHDLPDLARRLLRHRGDRVLVLAPRLPGAPGRGQAGGALLPDPQARIAGPTFEAWLAGRAA